MGEPTKIALSQVLNDQFSSTTNAINPIPIYTWYHPIKHHSNYDMIKNTNKTEKFNRIIDKRLKKQIAFRRRIPHRPVRQIIKEE
jgi:hypothetical protein